MLDDQRLFWEALFAAFVVAVLFGFSVLIALAFSGTRSPATNEARRIAANVAKLPELLPKP
jgi:hypothetical protein